ncbi:cobalamin biosynthesis protein [Natronohydrobacter thiooxidans]|uniref:cobalamin biosynthesis protein n=1 Tax=Natronohydrobacter thiooxidans TaxID=87172 RepID=UPI0008FF3B3A|nr:cobalamin biosynthesis protein [Natronohydrobacter thiooxidans]
MIVAGFGFRGSARAESLASALARCRGAVPDMLASADDKAQSPVFRAFAARLGLPVIAVTEDALVAQSTLTQSAFSLRARGTGSVAEAAALAAAGPNARLIGPREISADGLATCALAEGDTP